MTKRSFYNTAMLLVVVVFFNIRSGIAQTEADRNPLGYAVLKADAALVKDLLSKGANPNKTHDQETPLVLATKMESDEIFNILVNAKGIKLDAPSTYIWTGNGSRYTCTALISAVSLEKVGMVRTLLDKGANPDLYDKNVAQQGDVTMSVTALMHAIMLNRANGVEMLKMLLEKTKNLNSVPTLVKDGYPAPVLACGYPLYNEVSKEMFKRGAKFEFGPANNTAYTAIGHAITGKNPEMVKHLLDLGAKLNDKTDKAFLHLAIALGVENLETIKILLDSGIDPNIRFSSSKYPVINYGVKCKDLKVLELMIARGADVNAKDGIGQSVLKYAKGGKKAKKNVKYLIKQGAKD